MQGGAFDQTGCCSCGISDAITFGQKFDQNGSAVLLAIETNRGVRASYYAHLASIFFSAWVCLLFVFLIDVLYWLNIF